MTDKKLTDEEIIKNLKFCEDCSANINIDIIDLITRQQTEIERLRKEVNLVSIQFQDLQELYEETQAEVERLKDANNTFEKAFHIQEQNIKDWLPITVFNYEIKTEAYKECLAKVKNYIKTHCNPYGKPDFDYDTSIKILNFIDNLVKEMVGENNDL